MQLVLVGAAVVSVVALQEWHTAIVVFAVTLLNAILGLNQEGKAAESVAALQGMLVLKAHARRGGELVDIPAEELVPGDVVSFEAGDKIPADGRLLVAATLEIEEAALTGESTPVPKALESVEDKEAGLGDRVDMAYMNSTVTRGRGEMVVMATHRTAWDPRRRPRRSGRHLRGGRRNRARSPLRLSDLSLGDGPGGSDLATPAIAALSLCGIAYGQ
jgi:Ca2+-transporting ATPase